MIKNFSILLGFLIALAFTPASSGLGTPLSPAGPTADLVVYGGTASGVMTAYTAAREGLQVVLLEPGAHLGGMVTGGLSATDIGNPAVIGGFVRDFYLTAAAQYGIKSLVRAADWRSEPHVDERIFRSILKEEHVRVYFHEQLRAKQGVEMQGTEILALRTADGRRWPGKIFADCSYEGDLMAEAHVRFTEGRESRAAYGESLAGVQAHTTHHNFSWPISAFDSSHHLLPEIQPGPLAAPGSGDHLVQSYNFRPVLTNDPSNRLPFPRPAGYDRARFALLQRYIDQFPQHCGRPIHITDLFLIVPIPNHKADFNNNGPFSTDYIGHSSRYPDASYAERAAIWRDHLLYTQSLFYYLSTDKAVPASLRAELNAWGLPKDEFTDTDHWPNQLYVREGRRMLGTYVMRQADLQTQRTKPDSIGMGSYNSDSHNVERVSMPDGSVQNEGNVEVPVQPYEIPYRSIIPQRGEVENLLVPVCLSATHVAYSSLRMEPQYMIIGQAAGAAASLAVHSHRSVQDVSIPALQRILRKQGAILHWRDAQGGSERLSGPGNGKETLLTWKPS